MQDPLINLVRYVAFLIFQMSIRLLRYPHSIVETLIQLMKVVTLMSTLSSSDHGRKKLLRLALSAVVPALTNLHG